jgi:hypothetical protein
MIIRSCFLYRDWSKLGNESWSIEENQEAGNKGVGVRRREAGGELRMKESYKNIKGVKS